MLKRYCTTCATFDIHLEINSTRVVVPFEGRDVLQKLRFLDTDDKELQKALEATPAFNVYFYKSGEFDWMELEAKEEEEAHVDKSKTFKSVIEAKEWINKTHNIPYSRIKNMEALENEFSALGFQLIIETVKK